MLTSYLTRQLHQPNVFKSVRKSFMLWAAFGKIQLLSPICRYHFTAQESLLYSERACTPIQMSSYLLEQISSFKEPSTQHRQLILHQLSLYYNKILIFDYDYFCESLKRLAAYQSQLTVDQILMLFELAIEYKIDNLLLKAHFENQLHCRLYTSMKRQLIQYDDNLEKEQKAIYSLFEKHSKDVFNIVDEKFIQALGGQKQEKQSSSEQQQTSLQQQQQTQFVDKFQPLEQLQISQNKPIYNYSQRRQKAKKISVQQLTKMIHVFLESNSKNIEFNKLLLEVLTVRLDENIQQTQSLSESEPKQPSKQKRRKKSVTNSLQIDPNLLVLYTRLAVNLLQQHMSEYHAPQNVDAFTQRSIKKIYKLQTFYYYEIAKLIQQKKLLLQANDEQIISFVSVLSSFPIKRRSFRKSFGLTLIQEFKRRDMLPDRLRNFFELSRYDNKILQLFQQKINKGKSLLVSSSDQKREGTQIQKQQSVPLVEKADDKGSSTALFTMPNELFRKVTKRKSKPKNKHFKSNNTQQIDLTKNQPQQTRNVLKNNEDECVKGQKLQQI